MSDTPVPFEEHERLALAVLAVEAIHATDVKDAMRKIIASAPESTDIALLLVLAIAHARDRLASQALLLGRVPPTTRW